MKKSPLLINNIALGTATLLAGAITGAANVASTLFTNSSNRSAQESANQANLDLWREQTAYNNPTNQMQRLRQAGLNPDLMYGQNGVTANAASSAPQMLASQSVAPQLNPLTAAQIANINADTQKKEQDIEESKSRIEVNQNSITIAGREIDLKQNLTDAQVRQIDADISLVQPTIDKMVSEVANLKAQFKILDEHSKQEVVNTAIKVATKDASIRKIISDADLNDKQLDLLVQQYLNNPRIFASQISLNSSIASLNDVNAYNSILQSLYDGATLSQRVDSTIEQLKHAYNVAKVDNALDADVTGFSSYVLQFLGRLTSNIKIIHQ